MIGLSQIFKTIEMFEGYLSIKGIGNMCQMKQTCQFLYG